MADERGQDEAALQRLSKVELQALAIQRGLKQRGVGWQTCCPPKGAKEDIVLALLKHQQQQEPLPPSQHLQPETIKVAAAAPTQTLQSSIEGMELSDQELGQLTALTLNGSVTEDGTANFSNYHLNRFPSLPTLGVRWLTLAPITAGLTQLHLQNNCLTELPLEIGELAALQLLDLSSNKLQALPESLFRLTALETLHLSNNQLTVLSERILRLVRLAVLHLHNNRFQSLPCNLGRLPHLRDLGIGFQPELRSLPPSLALLRGKLKSLWFRGQNRFENIQLPTHVTGPDVVLDQLQEQLQATLKSDASVVNLTKMFGTIRMGSPPKTSPPNSEIKRPNQTLQLPEVNGRRVLGALNTGSTGSATLKATVKIEAPLQHFPATKSSKPRTFAVIDTNIFLKPEATRAVIQLMDMHPTLTVTVARAVMLELEGLKQRSDEIGANARSAIRFFRRRLEAEDAQLRVQALSEQLYGRTQTLTADHRILDCALYIRASVATAQEAVVLVTEDQGLQVMLMSGCALLSVCEWER